ncbi:DUF4170 domain-containing protein [Roseomonas sp. SSH11]|uniref:DUF4170 domain-containing protein n=1 Tax=Pararoseomonas baculiformis TaxID=2820812 RepID=A0ABS4AC81_9PROT|nr:DUF4170 domain-containing protein [Pararoseomonas baculiformis]MBP0444620.1 DUF4170 domain-containing protein [Pararoseomonas baculiformis]
MPDNSYPQLHFIWGGVFTDASFSTLEPGTEESYGPYHDVKTADRVWNEKARRNIDIANHRLFVISVPRPGGAKAA